MKKISLSDAESHSQNVVAENIEQLKALFPEACTEEKVDFEVLRQLLGDAVEEREEKYGLNWHGKRRARQLALTPSTGTLRPCPDESVDWDTTKNLMIEGDNLEVLKLLQKSYAGKVKLIYIDPPYNTGKDFVYPDDFRDNISNYLQLTGQIDSEGRRIASNSETSGRFHTDWLNMMYPRLRLARNLLKDDGVILISIDDYEIDNLRTLADEIFGEENFIANMIWEKGRKNDAKLFSVGHEYVLVYAKSLSSIRESKIKWREEKPGARDIWNYYLELREQFKGDDDAISAKLQGWYSSLPKSHPAKKWSRYKNVDKNGPWRDYDISWPGGDGPKYDVIHPQTHEPCAVPERGWVFARPETMQEMIRRGVVVFREDHSEPPLRKLHLRPIEFELEDTADEDYDDPINEDGTSGETSDDLATQVRGTYFYKQSQVTAKYMRKLMGASIFSNPKDHEEIAKLIDYVTAGNADSIILDFFAGSGTTGHAVWELNATTGGSRRFILVQLPEPLSVSIKDQKKAAQFCEQIERPALLSELTKERLRRAAATLNQGTLFSADLGFRVFKLASSNIREWDPQSDDLATTLQEQVEHLKTDRTEQDILFELLLKLGLDLAVPIENREIAGKTVHSIGGGVLIACLATQVAATDVEALALGVVEWHKELAPATETTIVFRDSAFADDIAKTNMTAILHQYDLNNVRSL